MKKLLYFILILAAGAVHAQSINVVDNGRNYYVNKPILGQTTDQGGANYILLHESYTGALISEMYVMGRITGIRGNIATNNRKWTVEVNTSSAYNSTKGSLISYNDPGTLVTVVYNGKSYLAAEIANGGAIYRFSFTGYAYGETLQLVTAQ